MHRNGIGEFKIVFYRLSVYPAVVFISPQLSSVINPIVLLTTENYLEPLKIEVGISFPFALLKGMRHHKPQLSIKNLNSFRLARCSIISICHVALRSISYLYDLVKQSDSI